MARAADRRALRGDAVLPPRITPQALRRSFVTLCAQLGRSAAWVQRQIGHADMTTMQRYYLQASMSEIDPRMRGLVDYLLGEGQPPCRRRRRLGCSTRAPRPRYRTPTA
jgi:integrase